MNMRQVVETLAGEAKRSCPACKTGTLDIVEATIVEQHATAYHNIHARVPERGRECIAAACSSCEFMTEIKF